MKINDNQRALIHSAWVDCPSLVFNPQRDGHKLRPGTHVFIKGEPVTITEDNGFWFSWVPGHVDLFTANNRSIIELPDETTLVDVFGQDNN